MAVTEIAVTRTWKADESTIARAAMGGLDRLPSMTASREPTVAAAVLSFMRVREENCNMVLLAAVTLFSAMVAMIAGWWQGPQPSAAESRPSVNLAGRTEVRVVGTRFMPNVNPRDR
jgi:hypothetical protein